MKQSELYLKLPSGPNARLMCPRHGAIMQEDTLNFSFNGREQKPMHVCIICLYEHIKSLNIEYELIFDDDETIK